MAHFAQLDENNTVLQVIVVNNSELQSKEVVEQDGFVNVVMTESEAQGIAFCQGLFGADTVWKQTSYSGSFRGKYAGIGYKFENGVFFNPDEPVVIDVQATTQDIQVLATQDIQVLSSAQVQVLETAQIQALTTDQISALGA